MAFDKKKYSKKYNKKYYIDNQEKEKKRAKLYRSTLRGSSMTLLHNYNRDDKDAGRPQGDLTVEDVIEMRLQGCTYKDQCGTTDWRLIGINRKDNNLPHTKANCEPCCFKCNLKLNGEYMKSRRGQSISQIDITTNEVIAIYPSINDAADAVGGSHSNIIHCCNGGYFVKGKWKNKPQAYGYIWKRI